eukprot:2319942-Pleurochrysis_carterae.AAC.1
MSSRLGAAVAAPLRLGSCMRGGSGMGVASTPRRRHFAPEVGAKYRESMGKDQGTKGRFLKHALAFCKFTLWTLLLTVRNALCIA